MAVTLTAGGADTGEPLRVLGRNPFEGIATQTRIKQMLQTHQGRDKLFKVAQYMLRMRLWWNSVDFNINYLPGEEFSRMEKNLMTIINSRRLFRLGRFFGEFVRIRVTLIKASELVGIPINGGYRIALFVQFQMIVDMLARGLLFVKCFCEDIAFLMQKGFFHSNVAGRLIDIATQCGLPVLCIDLFLNSLRLYQGILDASAPQKADDITFSKDSFSLLSKYDRVDKLRRKVSAQAAAAKDVDRRLDSPAKGGAARVAETSREIAILNTGSTDGDDEDSDDVVFVDSYAKLLWTDFELHWICVTQTKLLLDIFVATSNLNKWNIQGPISVAGFCSGLCSVYRVWTYGR